MNKQTIGGAVRPVMWGGVALVFACGLVACQSAASENDVDPKAFEQLAEMTGISADELATRLRAKAKAENRALRGVVADYCIMASMTAGRYGDANPKKYDCEWMRRNDEG